MSIVIGDQGTFEPNDINLIGRSLRPGYNFLNVGANLGL
jgi:hypothetical protein